MGERGGRKGRKEGEKEGEKEREKARERKRRKQQRRSVAWLPVVPLSAQHRGSVGGGWVGGWRAEALARETPNAGGPDEEATSGARAGGARRPSSCFSGGNSQQQLAPPLLPSHVARGNCSTPKTGAAVSRVSAQRRETRRKEAGAGKGFGRRAKEGKRRTQQQLAPPSSPPLLLEAIA